MDTKPEDKKKKLLIGGSIMAGLLLLLIGAILYVTKSDESPKPATGYETSTPIEQNAAENPGELAIEPNQIQLMNGPAGSIQGVATISANYQDLEVVSIQTNDIRYSWDSTCIAENAVLDANTTCAITISYNEEAGRYGTESEDVQPILQITGRTNTVGGDIIPVDAEAAILLPPSLQMAAEPSAQGQPAPEGIDPYGPAPYGSDQNAPPIDYSQAPIQPPQPMLSPKEQFVLARRQAVFGGMQPRAAAAHVEAQPGTWDELNIPTSTSSSPQDMSRTVTMDRVITAALVRTYDSRSPQQVVAQVDRNVYGGHSRSILIPRGSRLIGTASGGTERVAISWTQLIRPDGARFVIEASTGDAMGQAGAPGRVNERILKRYGSILLGTALNVGTARVFDASESAGGADFAQPARNNGAIISDIVRQDIERITNDIVQRNSNIQPIVTVPAGTRITIIPTMDLKLRPAAKAKVAREQYPRAQNANAPLPAQNVSVPAGANPGADGTPEIQFGQPQENVAPANTETLDLSNTAPAPMGSVPTWELDQ